MDWGVPGLPLSNDSFVSSLDGLEKRASKSKLNLNCLYLDSLYRCNGMEFSLRLRGPLYHYPALSCHGKCLLEMLILS